MTISKFDINTINQPNDRLAVAVPAEDLFSWRHKTITTPENWFALVTHKQRDTVLVHPGRSYDNTEAREVLFVRTDVFEGHTESTTLRSSDGHEFRGQIRVNVRIVPEIAEFNAFRRTLLPTKNECVSGDLQRYLEVPMHRVLQELTEHRSAETLLAAIDHTDVRQAVNTHLGGPCLTAGLQIEEPIDVRFDSPVYIDHQRTESQLERSAKRAQVRTQIQAALSAAQQQQLSELMKLLEQLHDAGTAHEDLNMADLLRTFDESQRSRLYAALWQICPATDQTHDIAVISGNELLLFVPDDLSSPTQRIELSDDLGPLRSITVDADSLEAGVTLIGAATGVHLLDLATGKIRRSLSAPDIESKHVRGGFNAAAMAGNRVFATHSELGLIGWPTEGHPIGSEMYPDLTADADAVRGVQIAEAAVWFAADQAVYSFALQDDENIAPKRHAGSGAMISALCVAGGCVYAGNADGEIIAWHVGEPDTPRIVRGQTDKPAESIAALDTLGVPQLIVADRGSALIRLTIDDHYACRYEAANQIVRRAAIAEDLFAAVNDTRDRLLIWKPDQPNEPVATTVIPHLTGERIQDLCLIPRRKS